MGKKKKGEGSISSTFHGPEAWKHWVVLGSQSLPGFVRVFALLTFHCFAHFLHFARIRCPRDGKQERQGPETAVLHITCPHQARDNEAIASCPGENGLMSYPEINTKKGIWLCPFVGFCHLSLSPILALVSWKNQGNLALKKSNSNHPNHHMCIQSHLLQTIRSWSRCHNKRSPLPDWD